MSQLRSFKNYANTAPVSPTLTGGLAQQTTFPCVLINLDGYAAAAGWLQIFDLAATSSLVSGTTVPLKSFNVAAAGPLPSLFQSIGGVSLYNGLVIAYSSTETVYTAVATSYDVHGEIDDYENDLSRGTTIINIQSGPNTSNAGNSIAGNQVIWGQDQDTTGRRIIGISLYSASVQSACYLCLYRYSSPIALPFTDSFPKDPAPVTFLPWTPKVGLNNFFFGSEGLRLVSQVNATSSMGFLIAFKSAPTGDYTTSKVTRVYLGSLSNVFYIA